MQQFFKYQGAGNDFIVIDNRLRTFDASNCLTISKLCDRRFGIGADGLMLLQEKEGYDFEMVYFNADGREGSLCGNGGRCIVAFAHALGLFKDKTVFLAADGEHTAYLTVADPGTGTLAADSGSNHFAVNYTVKLQMNDVSSIRKDGDAWVLDTGSPHFVQEAADLSRFPLLDEARKIRYGVKYGEKGINVNYVEALPGGGFAIRTYERGVEDETLACGTGATAAALAMAHQKGLEGSFRTPIRALGGQLTIHFHKQGFLFTEIYLEGPATFVYEGKVDLDRNAAQ